MNSTSTQSAAPAHTKAIACFAKLLRMGVSIDVARAIACQYAPRSSIRPTFSALPLRPPLHIGVAVSVTVRDGADRDIMGNV